MNNQKRGVVKKGAIELSVNMLIVIIISLVILAGGITLLYKFLGGAVDFKLNLDAQTENELQRMLVQDGKIVALPVNKAIIPRGEQKTFGLGVMNIGKKETFTVFVNPSSPGYFPPSGPSQDNPPTNSWVLYDDSAFSLEQQQQHTQPILISVPNDAENGIYLFDVSVRKGDGQAYGGVQKIQIEVKE